ncbi:MAG: GIY-YIG nuclease family protein [Alphaproteobacteria bacterium]|nr:GIY-YIG nuclease family protein [Alphaproteobacteria bacterium]
MVNLLIGLGIGAIALLIYGIAARHRRKQDIQHHNEDIQRAIAEARTQIRNEERSYVYNNERKTILADISNELSQLQKQRDLLIKNQERELNQIRDQRFEDIEIAAQAKVDRRADEFKRWEADRTKLLEEKYAKLFEEFNQKEEELVAKLTELTTARDRLQNEVDTINAENHKAELEQHDIDMHRIILSDSAKEDLKFLDSITSKLHHPEILYKLMWSEYVQKPFQQMVKNIFGDDVPRNVIYCIENLENHKKYIGKTSAEVNKRWAEHVKSSLNIGTISAANIHKVLYLDWDNFYFSIIEKVDNDQKLSDREKFYIDFYKSNIYGYNIKAGG